MQFVHCLLGWPAAFADPHALPEKLLEMEDVFEYEAVVGGRPPHRCHLRQQQEVVNHHHYSPLLDVQVHLARTLLLPLHQLLHQQDRLMLR